MSHYLSKFEIEEARYLRNQKFLTYKEIARRFGCKASDISKALKENKNREDDK